MTIIRVLMQTVGLALQQIRVNKVRAFLTALGIIIGVGSVTAVIGGLTGMQASVMEQFEAIGARKMWVWGQVPRELRGVIPWQSVKIKPEEIEALQTHCPSIDVLTPIVNGSRTVSWRDMSVSGARITGIRPAWHEIENRFVQIGRPFSSIDEDAARPVAIINDLAIEELNMPLDPVGESLLIDNRRFLIVGVVETPEVEVNMGPNSETRAEVYIPFATFQKMDRWSWPYIIAQVVSPEVAEDARDEVRFTLRSMRDLPPDYPDTFGCEVMQENIERFGAVAAGITTIAGAVVSVSLLVGGIGIMNIMLVSVSERTREIGLRKAVGAKPSIVLMQFLTEAVTLCLAGGVIGVTLGQALTLAMQAIPDAGLEGAEVPMWAFGLAFGFCAATGVIFGMFPAIKASRLDPISALRSD